MCMYVCMSVCNIVIIMYTLYVLLLILILLLCMYVCMIINYIACMYKLLRFALRSLAMRRVCALAPSFVSGWRAFSFDSLCKSVKGTERVRRKGPPVENKTRCNRTHTAQSKATQSEAEPQTQNPHTGCKTGQLGRPLMYVYVQGRKHQRDGNTQGWQWHTNEALRLSVAACLKRQCSQHPAQGLAAPSRTRAQFPLNLSFFGRIRKLATEGKGHTLPAALAPLVPRYDLADLRGVLGVSDLVSPRCRDVAITDRDQCGRCGG
jgi:hypothetical protein